MPLERHPDGLTSPAVAGGVPTEGDSDVRTLRRRRRPATPSLPPTRGCRRTHCCGRNGLPVADRRGQAKDQAEDTCHVCGCPGADDRDTSQWGADESIRDSHVVGWAPFRKIVVHHTASPNGTKDPAATVRYGYELHVIGRGFTDIGYNFLIGPDGEIFEGRRARKYGPHEIHTGEDGAGNAIIGGHTKDRNPGSCGIALIGNFMKTSPSNAAIQSLIHLISWEAQRHRIDPLGSDQYITTTSESLVFHNIAGHRDIGATLCPGTRMAASMGWLRHQVAERVGSYPARKADMRRLAWMLE